MQSNRIQGIFCIILALVIGILGFAYTFTSESIISNVHRIGPSGECIHPPDTICPIAEIHRLSSIKHAGIVLNIGIFLFGIFLFFRRQEISMVKSPPKKAPKDLVGDEKRVIDLLMQSENFVFQNELSEQLSLSKVQLTRTLDKLEAKGLIERRRRGMTNAVLLK